MIIDDNDLDLTAGIEAIEREGRIERKNLIKKIIKGTLVTISIIGLALGGYYVGCYDSTPARIYKTKIKVGHYQYEVDGYVVEDRKGDKFTFQKRDLEEITNAVTER